MDSYWRSREGELHRYRVRSWRRTLISVMQEPESKGGDATPQVAFRREVRRQLGALDLRPRPRATLAVDLRFRTTTPQPPHLHNLAKHYLDLLGGTHAPTGDPGPVLFNDDAQVGLLHVSARSGADPSSRRGGSINITASTRADVVADVRLAGDLLRDHEDVFAETHWADYELPDDAEAVNVWPIAQDEPVEGVAEWLHWWDVYRAQERLLRATDRWLFRQFLASGHRLLVGKDPMLDRLQAALRRSSENSGIWGQPVMTAKEDLLNPLLTVRLPPLPTRQGQGKGYRDGIAAAFADAVRTHPLYRRLLVPVRATIIVAPPARPPRARGRDLDNVMIDVLTQLHTVVRAPREPFWMFGDLSADELRSATAQDDRVSQHHRRGRAVTSCQVIRLHPEPADDEGLLVVALGHGDKQFSLWSEAHHLIDDVLDRVQ